MRLFSLPLLTAAALLAPNSLGHAQNPNRHFFELQLGQRPPIVVATAATGPEAKKHPFDAKTYGLTRGFVPSITLPKPNLVVYTRTLDSRFASLAARLDVLAGKSEAMGGPFVNVFDAKGAQRGGYTAEEAGARLAQLESYARAEGWKSLSIGLAASPTAAGYVGLDAEHEVTLVCLDSDAKIVWKRSLSLKDQTGESLAALEAELRKAVRSALRDADAL